MDNVGGVQKQKDVKNFYNFSPFFLCYRVDCPIMQKYSKVRESI